MEIVGGVASVTGIVAEVRYAVNSIKTRIGNVKRGRGTFQGLTDDLNKLMGQIGAVETYVGSGPASAPSRIRSAFLEDVKAVRDILNKCDSTLEEGCGNAFKGSEGGASSKVKSFFRRMSRATALSETMKDIQQQVQIASTKLENVIATFVTEENIQERHDVVVTKFDNLEENIDVVVSKLDNMGVTGNEKEEYRVGASTLKLPQGTTLNFDAKDEDGKPCTPEGILKESILSADSSSAVTAATGVLTPAHGVLGMAGVGKTIALQGLAFNDEICSRFPDGVQFMSLGQKATFLTARGEVAKIMRLTGASTSVSAVEESESLREVIDYAVAWFDGKICLFLVDDLWPTDENKTGFLSDISQLLRSCAESRMAITTRSTHIAHSAGRRVDFSPRDALGDVSVRMFMAHAKQDFEKYGLAELTGDVRKSIVRILTSCGGLPIALAVAGSAVGFLTSEHGDFEGACGEYASLLEKQSIELGEEQGPGGRSLNAELALSLKIVEAGFVKLQRRHGVVVDHTIADLYTSLCVVQNQAWVPISVLSRMWKMDKAFALAAVRLFSGLSLCKLTFREDGEGRGKEGGLMLHDLQLDFCRRQAEIVKTSSVWHVQLLNGYLIPEASTCEDSVIADDGDSFERKLLEQKPRPWWSVGEDEYILVELARHLVCADLMMELGALLLDARWTYAHGEKGGMLALKSDFDCLLTLGDEVIPVRVRQSFELLWKAIQLSWGGVTERQRPFLLQVCGQLFKSRTENAVVDAYLKSVEWHTPKPYLRPVNAFFPDPRSAQIMEIPVRGVCWTVDCSPCGRFVAVGAGSDVVVADASTGDILKRLKGHTNDVTCVSFAAASKTIVSGSSDKSIAMWEWKTCESPVRVLEGHSKRVNDVAVSSDGEKIFSCDDGKLMIWEASSGAQIRVVAQQYPVRCVAVSNDDQSVAIGLDNGTLKVLDVCTGNSIFEDADAHGKGMKSVSFSGTGKRLVTGSKDKTIRVWETGTWTSIGQPFEGHTHVVMCVRFSPDGGQIASGSYDGTVRLWDASSGRNTWTSASVHGYLTSVSFSPNGGTIFSGCYDGTVLIWDTRVETEASEFEYGHASRVLCVALSHDGLVIASASEDGTVRLWDSRTGNQIGGAMEGHTDRVWSVSFSHDGRRVVSGSWDKTVRLWDAETFTQIGDAFQGHRSAVRCVSFSSDGQRIVSGSWDKTVRIWDVESGKQIGDALKGHESAVMAVSESGDGSHVVSRGRNGVVIIWNRDTRNYVWKSGQGSGASQDERSSERVRGTKYEVTDKEAEEIIRSCGQQTRHVWPDSFPAYTAEAYLYSHRDYWVFSNVPTEDTLLGNFPFALPSSWQYSEASKVFVGGLQSGAVAICNLIVKDE